MSESRHSRASRINALLDRAVLVVAVAAVFALLLEWGWGATLLGVHHTVALALTVFVVAFFLFETFARLFTAESALRYARDNIFDLALTAAFLTLLFGAASIHRHEPFAGFFSDAGISLSDLHMLVAQGYIVLMLVSKAVTLQKYIAAAGIRPAAFVVFTFALVIVMGTVLLTSPHAMSREARDAAAGRGATSFPTIDALFTSASAVCVTGLVVLDTEKDWSLFGQSIILVLMQIGGLGLMTFVTIGSLLIGKGIGLQEGTVMQDMLAYDIRSQLPKLLTYILLITFGSEALGAALMYPVWEGPMPEWRRLFVSVFHSVSAFCNAGFSVYGSSMIRYVGNVTVNLTITGLIIWGGLGFIVQMELLTTAWRALRPRWRWHARLLRNLSVGEAPLFLSLQTKIVVFMTIVLLATGAVLFGALEWGGVLEGLSFKERILASWFHSVVPRTAGFNSINMYFLAPSTYFLVIVLMFIGASPGSTGGGIKTSTFAILVANVTSALRHRREVEIFKRSIPDDTSRQAVMVGLLATGLVAVGVFLLALTHPWISFERLLFEQVSAFATVGLSAGAGPDSPLSLSANLSWFGKLVIIVTMFAGRIGPLTLVVAVAQRRRVVDYEYPSERVVIG